MQSYAKFISKVQNVGFGVDAKTGKALTKYLSPPEIYMQKQLVLWYLWRVRSQAD